MAGITLKQLSSRLKGELDVLPASSLRDRIRDALRDIYDEEEWGCFFVDSYIRTPAQILGTASVEQFSQTITLDSATNTLLTNATDTPDKIQAEERQIRILSPTQTDRAFYYNITAYDSGTGELTIDIPFQDVTNAAIRVQIVKLYYSPPLIDIGTTTSPNLVRDFKRFEYIVSPMFNRRLRLDITQEELNRVDITRIRTGDPEAIIPKGIDANGDMLYEMYPVPIFDRVLRVKYLRTGLTPTRDTDTIPNFFSQRLVLEYAKAKGYEWILGNISKIPNLKSATPYMNLLALSKSPNSDKSKTMMQAKKRDEELYPRAYVGNFENVPYYAFDYGLFFERGIMLETVVIDAQYPS